MKALYLKNLHVGATTVLLLSVLIACDSNSTSSSVVTDTVDPLDFIDVDNLHLEQVEALDPGPSLGFALPPNGRIHARTGAVGSPIGNEFQHACENGQILAGVSGFYSNRIEKVQALCVATDDSGQWIGSPAPIQDSSGNNNGQSFTRLCPVNQGVVALTSDFANTYPAYLQLHCGSLIDQRKTSTLSSTLNAVGSIGNGEAVTTLNCASRAVATGLYGHASSAIEQLGLVCYEDPAFAGRWSSRIDWPRIAIHSVVLSDGKVLTYGTGGSGVQGAMEYSVWDPMLGIGQSAHNNLQGVSQVDSFCSAATLIPESGDVLMSGGDARPLGRNNSGIRDATLYSAVDKTVNRANDMQYARWYPTSTTLPDGDIVVVGGRNFDNVHTATPEVYSTVNGNWRALSNASTAAYSYFYPRQFVAPDGRIFGISGKNMFYLSTDGNGALTDAGDLPNFAHGTTATAAMYQPGKILYTGGAVNNGKGAAIIDVTSGIPQVSRTQDLAEPRRAWSSMVLLADGKAMVVGGSYITNDAVTASLGAETWDPSSEKWTQYSRYELARLYHSTAVLLMDGRVLMAGGGSPGPLNNTNAEIFSPPYLFDESGSLAERPDITYAPEVAAWGQQAGIRTNDNNQIARVTLVKTGSITHGFNMDQRFLDLPFSVQQDSLSVTMPASGNVAPPGFYLLFVHDSNGTPSVAQMISLGTQAAPSLPPLNTNPQLPNIADNTLLLNGGFEQGKQSWLDCAEPQLTSPDGTSVEGDASIKVSSGGCLYQTVLVQPGASYDLNCYARGSSVEYSSMSLQILDAGYAELVGDHVVVESDDFENLSLGITAPANAYHGSVTLYSEGTAYVDRCELVESAATTPQPPTTPVIPQANSLINNGDFEQGKASWSDCSTPSLTSATSDAANGLGAMQVENAGCLYQEFPITPGKTYQLSCLSKSQATNYSSMSLTLMTDNYTALASDHKPVGRNFFQSYSTELFTPIDGRIGAVTLYSEDGAQFDDCAVIAL